MSAEKAIRAQARMTLKGGWLKAITALIAVLTVFAVADCVYTVLALLLISGDNADNTVNQVIFYITEPTLVFAVSFLLSPVFNGYVRLYYKASVDGVYHIEDLIYYFSKEHYRSALAVNIRFIIRMLLPTVVCFLPVIIFWAVFMKSKENIPLYALCEFMLTVLSSLLTVLWSLRYFAVFAAAVEFEYMDAPELFKLSKEIMRGNTGTVSRLILSFSPWLLLCMTVLPVIYVAPYMTQALCISSKWLIRSRFEIYD